MILSVWLSVWPCLVPAVEYALPSAPQRVEPVRLGTQTRMYCDWGAIGSVIPRHADAIDGEHRAFRDKLLSPEVQGWLMEQQAEAAEIERELGAAKGKRITQLYHEHAQDGGLPCTLRSTTHSSPIPSWLSKLPAEVRSGIEVAFIDARDTRQQAWAVALKRKRPQVHVYILGWTSLAAVDAWLQAHPILAGSSVVSEVRTPNKHYPPRLMSDGYGVKTLPAFVRIKGKELHVSEGLEVSP